MIVDLALDSIDMHPGEPGFNGRAFSICFLVFEMASSQV